MSSVRSAMCWQPGERYQSRYSWIWLFFLPVGRLVDRELDPAVAVGHDLRHQRRVLGVDDLVVVVDQLGEAEHVAVEVDELVHLAEPDVADAVVDLEQRQAAGRARRRLDLAVAGREGAVRSRVGRRTSGGPRRTCGSTPSRSVPSSPPSSSVGARAETAPRVVVSRQADSTSSTAKAMSWTPSPWRADVLGDLAVGRQRRGEHEPDVVLDHDVARPVADLGLEAAERDRREAPQRAVVGRGLAGVADPELDVVDALERQEVGGLGVGVRVDPGAGLVGGAAGDRSASSRVSPAVAGRRSASRTAGVWPSMLRLACHTGAHGRRCSTAWTLPRAGLAATRPAVEAGAPWPLAETLRRRRRSPLGTGRGPRPPRGDDAVLAGRDRAGPRGPPRAGAVRPGRDRPGPHRPRRARPVAAAARAVRPDRRSPRTLRAAPGAP